MRDHSGCHLRMYLGLHLWVHQRLVGLRLSPSWRHMVNTGTGARASSNRERTLPNEPNHMSRSIVKLAEDGDWVWRECTLMRRERMYRWSAVRVEAVECRLSRTSNLALDRRFLGSGVSGNGIVIHRHIMRLLWRV